MSGTQHEDHLFFKPTHTNCDEAKEKLGTVNRIQAGRCISPTLVEGQRENVSSIQPVTYTSYLQHKLGAGYWNGYWDIGLLQVATSNFGHVPILPYETPAGCHAIMHPTAPSGGVTYIATDDVRAPFHMNSLNRNYPLRPIAQRLSFAAAETSIEWRRNKWFATPEDSVTYAERIAYVGGFADVRRAPTRHEIKKKPRFDFTRLAESALQKDPPSESVHNQDVTHASCPIERTTAISSSRLTSFNVACQPALRKPFRVKRQYTCRFCGRYFSKSYNLRIHERTHTDERPFPCEICGKAFRRKDHLRDHRYIHMKEKPFKCMECGKSFCQSRTLSVHLGVHKNNSHVNGATRQAVLALHARRQHTSGYSRCSCDLCRRSASTPGGERTKWQNESADAIKVKCSSKEETTVIKKASP